MPYDTIIFRVHALQRMFERGMSDADVREILEDGEVIEHNPDDVPYPSSLMLGQCSGRPIHVVVSDDPDARTTIVVTVYDPDPLRWKAGFRKRRNR